MSFVSGIEAQCVCVNMISSVRWGHHSVLLTDWIPVKTSPLPLLTKLLLVRRHKLHLQAHTCCMRYQVGMQLCKGTRRHVYHGRESHLYSFLSNLLRLQRPEALNLDCMCTLNLYISRRPPVIKEHTYNFNHDVWCPFEMSSPSICLSSALNRSEGSRHTATYALSFILEGAYLASNQQSAHFQIVTVWVMLQPLYNLVAEVIGTEIPPPPPSTVRFGKAELRELWVNSCC